ncbi:MAG: nitroreductase family protein [Candidatus Izemoplasmataceae bacterium]
MKDIILKRKSIRTYRKEGLSDIDITKIHELIKNIESMAGPFKNAIRLNYHENQYIDDEKPKKIGTYGFVKNAKTFVSGKVNHSYLGLIDFGYLFEYFILKATEINLGTVWLGGTFNRKSFNILLSPQEVIPAITPIGYISNTQSFVDKVIRKSSKGDNRLSFDSLFFQENFNTPLDYKNNGLCEALNLIRLAPSASNKQPWRFLIKDQMLHVYIKRTPNYAKVLKYDIQAVDIGIALCHTVIAFNLSIETPEFLTAKPNIETAFEYIASIKLPNHLLQ